jgi:hypothetical protein
MTDSVYVTTPEHTQDQTTKRAQTVSNQISQFEYSAEVSAPGNVSVNPTCKLQISGTESAFDQTYDIMSVIHRFSVEHGYTMDIEGRASGSGSGSSPDNQTPTDTPSQAENDPGPMGMGVVGTTTPATQSEPPAPPLRTALPNQV